MEAFIPEFYFTPKTYGIEGLRFKGFELDNILSAGANLSDPDIVPKSTWQILKFHLKRSMLQGILNVYSTKDNDAPYKVQSTLLDILALALALLENVTSLLADITALFTRIMDWVDNMTSWIQGLVNGFITWLKDTFQAILDRLPFGAQINKFVFRSEYDGKKPWPSLFKSVSPRPTLSLPSPSTIIMPKKKRVPSPIIPSDALLASIKSIALIIHSNIHLAPPPPLLPNEKEQGNMSPEELSSILDEISQFEASEQEFLAAETVRVIDEAAMMIYWSYVLNLQHITLFENNALLSGHGIELIEVVKRKFEEASETMPTIAFAIPSQKTLYDVIGGSRVSLRAMEMLSASDIARDAQQRFPHSPLTVDDAAGPKNVKLKVVILDRKNGKSLTMKALRYACKLVEEHKLSPVNVERAMELYLGQFGIVPFQAVIATGYRCFLEGLPPLSVRDSIIW